jgi:N-acetylglutamate synthase-like GNAT family acetyltransferase
MDYTVRRFRPEDAAGIAAVVRRVYGETYVIHQELYEPARIVELNQSGRLVSVVAVDEAGQVVGHYALERPDLGRIAETGEAMVLPEHQHHHLLERMRVLIVEAAREAGLAGIFGMPVTNHVFSQKMYEHFEGKPVGIRLGNTPKGFHNIAQPSPQRISCLVYFRHFEKPSNVLVHAPARHREMIARIYRQFGLPVTFAEPEKVQLPQAGGSETVRYDSKIQCGFIQVEQLGAGTAAAIAHASRELDSAGAEAVFLDLPLSQPGTAELCAAAEPLGFFFGGIGPYFLPDGDALFLQRLNVPLDFGLLQIEHPFARELVDYVADDRRRVIGH